MRRNKKLWKVLHCWKEHRKRWTCCVERRQAWNAWSGVSAKKLSQFPTSASVRSLSSHIRVRKVNSSRSKDSFCSSWCCVGVHASKEEWQWRLNILVRDRNRYHLPFLSLIIHSSVHLIVRNFDLISDVLSSTEARDYVTHVKLLQYRRLFGDA